MASSWEEGQSEQWRSDQWSDGGGGQEPGGGWQEPGGGWQEPGGGACAAGEYSIGCGKGSGYGTPSGGGGDGKGGGGKLCGGGGGAAGEYSSGYSSGGGGGGGGKETGKGKMQIPPPPPQDWGHSWAECYQAGYQAGYDRSRVEGFPEHERVAQPAAAAAAKVSGSEADEGAGGGGRSGKRKSKSGGKFHGWYEQHIKTAPPDLTLIPRFEYWCDTDWAPYLEPMQVKIRDACVKKGDMTIEHSGEFEYDIGAGEPGYIYKLFIRHDKSHNNISLAIQHVSNHKRWKSEFEDEVRGWQANEKCVLRPIRAVWWTTTTAAGTTTAAKDADADDDDRGGDDDVNGDGRENN